MTAKLDSVLTAVFITLKNENLRSRLSRARPIAEHTDPYTVDHTVYNNDQLTRNIAWRQNILDLF